LRPAVLDKAEIGRQYRKIAEEHRLFRRLPSALVTVREIFGSVCLQGADVLDVGGGNGSLGIWAILNGARSVTCLEPEIAGATLGSGSRAYAVAAALEMSNFRVLPLTLKEYAEATTTPADLVVCNATINHIDENACAALGWCRAAQTKYIEVSRDFAKVVKPGGRLILADCSRYNFWPLLGLSAPVAKTIEWDKHQPPRVWRRLFEQAGFRCERTSWRSQALLGEKWSWVLQSPLVAHFTSSLFVLEFYKPTS